MTGRDSVGRLRRPSAVVPEELATRRAWLVLGLATLTATLTGPGQTIGVSVFIDHFVADLDLSRSAVSQAYLIGTISGAALLPSVGRAIDRFGVRPAQVLIGLAFAAALVNMSFVGGFATLAIGFVGIRFFGQGALSLAATVTVSLSFERARGTAIGLFSTVSGGLMALVPVAMAITIAGLGWRSTWLVSAALILVTVPTMAFIGLRSVGGAAPASDPSTGTERPRTGGGHDRAAAIATLPFWLLAATSAAAGMLGTGLNFHQIDLLGEAGMSATEAAALFVPQVIGTTVASIGTGFVSDRIGTRYLPAAGMATLVAAHWLAAVVGPGPIVVVYAIVLGATGGAVRTTAAALLPAWFGTAHLGSIQGTLTLFNVGASALGPVALAEAELRLGGYRPAVLALSLLPVIVFMFTLVPRANRAPIPTG